MASEDTTIVAGCTRTSTLLYDASAKKFTVDTSLLYEDLADGVRFKRLDPKTVSYYDDRFVVVSTLHDEFHFELENVECRVYSSSKDVKGFYSSHDKVLVVNPFGSDIPVRTEFRTTTLPETNETEFVYCLSAARPPSGVATLELYDECHEGRLYLTTDHADCDRRVRMSSGTDDTYLTSRVLATKSYVFLVPGETYREAVQTWERRVLPEFVIETDPPYADLAVYRGVRLLLP